MAWVPVYSRHRRSTPPCKGCEERVVGCHSVCEKYKDWKTDELKRMEYANNVYVTEKVANDYVVKKIRSMKAKKGRS